MNALLLVAHGSPLASSNQEVTRLTQALRSRMQADYGLVRCAFLELEQPSVEHGIEALVTQGARSITVVPYFLARGRHVERDLPSRIGDAQRRFPDVAIRVTKHLGAADGMVELICAVCEDERARSQP